MNKGITFKALKKAHEELKTKDNSKVWSITTSAYDWVRNYSQQKINWYMSESDKKKLRIKK